MTVDWRVRRRPLLICCPVHFLRPEVGSVWETGWRWVADEDTGKWQTRRGGALKKDEGFVDTG